jgi:hypothetical protein
MAVSVGQSGRLDSEYDPRIRRLFSNLVRTLSLFGKNINKDSKGALEVANATATVTGAVLKSAARADSSQNAITLTGVTTSVTDPGDSPANVDALRDDLVANTIPDIEGDMANLATRDTELETAVETLATEFNDLLAKLRTSGALTS